MSYHTHYLPNWQFFLLKLLTFPLLLFVIYGLYGFITNDAALFTVFPNAPAFSPIAALLFFITFLIMWTVLYRYKRTTIFLTLCIIAICLVSIWEQYYDEKTYLHIPYGFLTNVYFEPLAYECSIAFLVLASVFLIFTKTRLRAVELVTPSFLLWFVLSISQLSILYYLFFQPGVSTAADFTLSFPTTIGLAYVVGYFALFIYFHVWRLYPFAFIRWLIISFIFIGVTGGYATWNSAKKLENAFFQYLSNEIAVSLKDTLVEYVHNKENILQNMLSFLENPTSENEIVWKNEVSIYLQQNDEVLVVLGYAPLIDKMWEMTRDGSDFYGEHLYDLLTINPNSTFTIDPQPITPSFVITNRTNDESLSWMAYLVDINKLMTNFTDSALDDKVGVSVSWGGNILFFKHYNDQTYREMYGSTSAVYLTEPPLEIEIWPTTQQYKFLKSPLPNLILGFELSALLLAFIILYYAELAKRQGDLYRKAEAEKTAFFANVSHEIRTQLQGILGTGSILEKTSLTEKQQKMLLIIKASGKVLQRLLNDLLDVTKFDLGRMKLNPKPTNVSNSLRDVVTLMTPKAEDKGLKVTLKIDPNIPQPIIIDNDRFEQIISNLLSNAIKFTKKGSITISMRSDIMDTSNKTMLIVKVADTGIGIPAADIKHVFEKFFQIQSTQHRAIEGTGLGLPISKMLAEYMNGSLTCESALDKGTTFTLMLPVEYEIAAEKQP